MSYFRRRNNLVIEYSGFQEVSTNLRNRLYQIISKNLAEDVGIGQENNWVRIYSLEHELYVEMCKNDLSQIIYKDGYENVFTAVEIFLDLAEKQAWERYRRVIFPDISRAFELSGSVYFVNDENGQINLRVDEELAKQIEETKEVLKDNESAHSKFFNSVGNLMGRKDSSENIIKDLFVAFEDYLKNKTGEKDFGKALDYLQKKNLIISTQKALIEKLYAYRSDTYGPTHAGKGQKPDEIDVLWYLETTTSQLKLIDRRIKNGKP